MNQKEESKDNLPEDKVETFDASVSEENPAANESPVAATTQIVEDYSASPAEIIENALADEFKETIPEPAQIEEKTVASTPLETGVYQFVNAMVGKPYQAKFDLKSLSIETAEIDAQFGEQIGRLGLTAKREGDIFEIEGVPNAEAQGEHDIYLDYVPENDARVHRKTFTLLINPDPKSLWKNVEPEASLPHRKDHESSKQILTENFKIVAASRRGRSHAHEGKFREDDFEIRACENGWHALIVADGAGSASLSREGSRLACQTAMEFVEKSIAELLEPKFAALIEEFAVAPSEKNRKELKNLLYQVLCGAAFAAYKRLEQESTATGNAIKDYSTTFLLSIVKKCARGFFIAGFGIGDGAIGIYSESNGTIKLLMSPDGGEFSGQTRFLTMREVIGDGNEMLRRVNFKLFDEFTILALMTDGISDPKFGTDNNLVSFEKWKEFVAELLKQIDFNRSNDASAEQLLNYMDFWSPGEHDDRTLAILY